MKQVFIYSNILMFLLINISCNENKQPIPNVNLHVKSKTIDSTLQSYRDSIYIINTENLLNYRKDALETYSFWKDALNYLSILFGLLVGFGFYTIHKNREDIERQIKSEDELKKMKAELDEKYQAIETGINKYQIEINSIYRHLIKDVLFTLIDLIEDVKTNSKHGKNLDKLYEKHIKNIQEHQRIINLYGFNADEEDLEKYYKQLQALTVFGTKKSIEHLKYLDQRLNQKLKNAIAEKEKNEIYETILLIKKTIEAIKQQQFVMF